MNRNPNEWNKWISWILTILGFAVFWPLGLAALFRTLSHGCLFDLPRRTNGVERGQVVDVPFTEIHDEPGSARSTGYTSPRQREMQEKYASLHNKDAMRHNQAQGRPQPSQKNGGASPVKQNAGRGLRIGGIILAILGGFLLLIQMGSMSPLDFITTSALETAMLAAGLTMTGFGFLRKKKAARFRRYLSLIGGRDSLSIDALAEAMPVTYKKACADLQDMIEAGFLPPAARIDPKTRRLVLSEALEDIPEPAEPQPDKGADDDAVLREIKTLNDRIPGEAISRKIDRIGEITARILDYQRQNPDAAGELRSFLGYYLPTTLKLLRTYAQLEEQGIEGKNITEAKSSIEATMDKVVDGFEKQLDKLFQADALDITSDIQVLEQMLRKDGLAEDEMLKMEL